MSNAAYFFLTMVWLSVVSLVAVAVAQRSPKRRKPVDELEAADAALRNRLVDLEDKFEHYVKRESVRDMRARREGGAGEQPPPPGIDRASRLLELRARLAAKRAQGG
jgi:hypothetical protein